MPSDFDRRERQREKKWRREYRNERKEKAKFERAKTRERRAKEREEQERNQRERQREKKWRREYRQEQEEKAKLHRYRERRERASYSYSSSYQSRRGASYHGSGPKLGFVFCFVFSFPLSFAVLLFGPQFSDPGAALWWNPFTIWVCCFAGFSCLYLFTRWRWREAIDRKWGEVPLTEKVTEAHVAQSPVPPPQIAYYRSTSSLSPSEFEWEVIHVFQVLYPRFTIERTGGRGDQGVDAKLFDRSGALFAIIQAKRYSPGKAINPSFLRDLHSCKHRTGARFAVLVTTARFSVSTFQQARDMEIKLIDGKRFEKMRQRAYACSNPEPIASALSAEQRLFVQQQIQERIERLSSPNAYPMSNDSLEATKSRYRRPSLDD